MWKANERKTAGEKDGEEKENHWDLWREWSMPICDS